MFSNEMAYDIIKHLLPETLFDINITNRYRHAICMEHMSNNIKTIVTFSHFQSGEIQS